MAEVLDRADLPNARGVYLVVRPESGPRGFLAVNPAGRFKGRDPSVDLESLRANWVDDAEIVYIGKADLLRRRLKELAKFAAGHPIGHWGGRLLWQLEQSSELLVAWRETPEADPLAVEAGLIDDFRTAYGKPPFANMPHRSGR